MKLWVWRYAARKPELLSPSADESLVRRIGRRSWAVPVACAVAIAISFFNPFFAPLAFPLIPFFARLLAPERGGGESLAGEAPAG